MAVQWTKQASHSHWSQVRKEVDFIFTLPGFVRCVFWLCPLVFPFLSFLLFYFLFNWEIAYLGYGKSGASFS